MNPDPNDKKQRPWINKIKDTGSCYRLLLQHYINWYEAKAFCDELDAELLVIDNAVEHEVVKDILWEVNYTQAQNQYFFTDLFRVNDYYTDWKCNCHLYQTRYNESLHEIGYEPWAEDKTSLNESQWYDAAVVVRTRDGLLDEKIVDRSYGWRWIRYKPFCEKRRLLRPFY
ncbi:uncharacterized protein LOC125241142 [Leguminivora glycinivorella]|uniref:uncharacterized protein LOC125241142 n=1 Tax=Leguminivora glycinivorella TaxID=1035111 RepID=UPI00200FEC39|nr:uncharacterized protein LOC125241142 [Leguminivora glycinivorella]